MKSEELLKFEKLVVQKLRRVLVTRHELNVPDSKERAVESARRSRPGNE